MDRTHFSEDFVPATMSQRTFSAVVPAVGI